MVAIGDGMPTTSPYFSPSRLRTHAVEKRKAVAFVAAMVDQAIGG